MRRMEAIALCGVVSALTWIASSTVSAAHAQSGSAGSPVRVVGLGTSGSLPTQPDGTAYLPVLTQDRQLWIDTEAWQKNGDIMPLLLNRTTLPQRVVLCGHRMSLIQGSMRGTPNDDSVYFPLSVNGTGLGASNDGCVSITPVAYLRIRGITTMPTNQLPNVVVIASY